MTLERVKWPRVPVARYAREDPFAEYCPGLAPGLEPAAGPGRNETPGAAENHRLERELTQDPSEKFLSETAEKSAPPPPPSPAEEKEPPKKKKGGGKYYSFDQLGCSSCSMWSG